MSSSARGDGFARTKPASATRDPLGKSALFSSGEPATAPPTEGPAPEGRGASHLFTTTEARAGTLVLDCSRCGERTRVSYAEFATLHFPLWAWLPLPTRTYRHWQRCPACHHFTWLRAGWFE